MKKKIWLEISLLEYWGPQPSGIPRVSQNVFLQSLKQPDVQHFYFDRERRQLVVPTQTAYFRDLAAGRIKFDMHDLPSGDLFEDVLEDGERVLVTEAGWDHPGHLAEVQRVRKRVPNSLFQYLLCDLIPVKFPHFFEEDFGGRAASYMRELPSFCDRYVCISKSTKADVRAILDHGADTRSFTLGSDVTDDTPDGVDGDDRERYVLSVGTFEVRKNHILLYFVWRRLALLLGNKCPKLVLVGRPGWISGDVHTLFQTDPVVKDVVKIRHDVPNEELARLIQESLFTVFPSYYEGWGLPASESLFYGRLCVTSNTSSLPEINPFPELMFDPYDHNAAFEVIRSLIEDPELIQRYEAQIASRFKRQTWEQSFEELYGIISS